MADLKGKTALVTGSTAEAENFVLQFLEPWVAVRTGDGVAGSESLAGAGLACPGVRSAAGPR
jgi:hypothetical protein